LEDLKERDHLEDVSVDGRTLGCILEIGWEVVDWIYLAHDRDL